MGSIIGFSLLGVVVLASIVVSTLAYSRQQANSLRKSQIRQIKHKIDGYQDMLAVVLRIDREYDLILMVHQQIILMVGRLLELEPDNEAFLQLNEDEQIMHTGFKSSKREQEISTALGSDQEINASNYQLMQISKLLLSNKKKALLSPAKASELYSHIKRLRLDIDVDSHIGQSDDYLKNNDRILAQSHLKQARETLKTSPIEFPSKTDQIKELSERIKQLASDASPQEVNKNEAEADQIALKEKPRAEQK